MLRTELIEKMSRAILGAMYENEFNYEERVSVAISILGSVGANELASIEQSGYKREEIERRKLHKLITLRHASDEMFKSLTEKAVEISVVKNESEI